MDIIQEGKRVEGERAVRTLAQKAKADRIARRSTKVAANGWKRKWVRKTVDGRKVVTSHPGGWRD